MPRALRWIVVSTGVAMLLAGCGGSTRFSAAKTTACLEDRGLKVLPPRRSDIVAQTAPAAIRIAFPHNEVTISFGDSRKEAERIVLAYEHFAGRNIGLADVLRPQKNAVLLWRAHPADEDASEISDCLE